MKRPLCLWCFLFFLVILLLVQGRDVVDSQDATKLPKEFCGTVYQIQQKDDQILIFLSAIADSNSKIICYFEKNQMPNELALGNCLSVKGRPRSFSHATNDGQFDQANYYGVMGIDYYMVNCSGVVIDAKVDYLGQLLYVVRNHLSGIIDHSMSEQNGAVLKAMLLGDKTNLDEDIKGLYQRNGISHIMAISGLHISMLGMGLYKFLMLLADLSGCMKGKTVATAISVGFVYLYGRMTGNSASAIRSMVMFSLFLIAEILIRTYDILTAMALSALILLIKQPFYATQCGFLLSFGAIMGIGVIADTIKDCMPFSNKISQGFLISISISIATLPVQLFYFYTFPIYSVFLNLIVIPVMSILMVCGVAGLLLGLLWMPLARVCFCPVEWILNFYQWLCQVFDGFYMAHPIIGRPGKVQIVLYYATLSVVVFLNQRKSWNPMRHRKKNSIKCIRNRNDHSGKQSEKDDKKKAWCHLFLYAGAILMLCIRVRWHDTCTMLDVGQGNCFVIEEKNGKTILYDGGSSDVSQVGNYRIIPYLKCHGISQVDYIFVSHQDKDHICGIEELLSDTKPGSIKVGCLILSELARNDEAFDQMRQLATEKGTSIVYMKKDDELAISNSSIVFRCLYPTGDEKGLESNDQSLAIEMTCKGMRTLFVGDLTSAKELSAAIPCDILQVGHHGSKYSTSAQMLDVTNPKIALISSGVDNSYGHPHKETLQRLTDCGTSYYRTDQSGAVTITYFHHGVKVDTFLHEKE